MMLMDEPHSLANDHEHLHVSESCSISSHFKKTHCQLPSSAEVQLEYCKVESTVLSTLERLDLLDKRTMGCVGRTKKARVDGVNKQSSTRTLSRSPKSLQVKLRLLRNCFFKVQSKGVDYIKNCVDRPSPQIPDYSNRC